MVSLLAMAAAVVLAAIPGPRSECGGGGDFRLSNIVSFQRVT